MNDLSVYCSVCGAEIISDDDYYEVEGQVLCEDCYNSGTFVCDCCGDRVLSSHAHSDDYIDICETCYNDHYSRCDSCNRLIHDDNVCYSGDTPYCEECYGKFDYHENIHEYNYKPDARFYGESYNNRFFGVELEIDGADDPDDKDGDAAMLLGIANEDDEHIYIKNDGSLNEGFEIVSHPMTLEYHKNFCWKELTRKAVRLGYRSHQISTCGLHVHVNRSSLADDRDAQEKIISRILYFIEMHWNEIFKFSRRTEASINRWAGRHGYEPTPEALMNKAKKNCNRYSALNLCNYYTIEFRIFKGTLKYNTLIATLEFVNAICEKAVELSDSEMAKMSWSEFVSEITEPELIQYLKERDLYVNEKVYAEEEM